jgi:H3 lysine-79-specific histone-lysine N-methyltransferase
MEQEQARYIGLRHQELMYRRTSGGTNPSNQIPSVASEAPPLSEECILKEIGATLTQRKKLHTQVSRLESEVMSLEKNTDSKPIPVIQSKSQHHEKPISSPHAVIVSMPGPPLPPPPPQTHHSKGRKGRESRSRSQEWPDIPDIGKIEEQNPEILAQKILETGRQIEAGKIREAARQSNNRHEHEERQYKTENHSKSNTTSPTKANKTSAGRQAVNNINNNNSYRPQESPPVLQNFEARLHSIITSVLNEEPRRPAQTSNSTTVTSNSCVTSGSQSAQSQYTTSSTASMPAPLGHTVNHCYPVPQAPLGVDVKARESRHQQHLRNSLDPNRHQPDYTQVSPAKLALRRHLSQEKLAMQMQQQQQELRRGSGGSYTRTIGDLVSGEIERTLEISNQSLINAAVDMSTNSNVRGDTMKVNDRISRIIEDSTSKKDGDGSLRTVYSPISRPSSTEGTPLTAPPPPVPSPQALEGLAYPHRAKSPLSIAHVATYPHQTYPQQPATSPLYTSASSRTVTFTASSSGHQESVNSYHTAQHVSSSSGYSGATRVVSSFPEDGHPVQLPRADIKPYHESYFTDNKPIVMATTTMTPTRGQHPVDDESYGPVEGLAASLHARIVNNTSHLDKSQPSPGLVPKDEFPSSEQNDCIMQQNKNGGITSDMSELVVKRERPGTPGDESPPEQPPRPPPRKRSASGAPPSPPNKVTALDPSCDSGSSSMPSRPSAITSPSHGTLENGQDDAGQPREDDGKYNFVCVAL